MSDPSGMVMKEIRQLTSRYPNGVLMYPGPQEFTWVLIGSVWHLLSIAPAARANGEQER